jgi:hypothetical protein
VLKEAIKRRKPDFSESYYGFRTFGNLLEEAQARGLLEFGRDEKSGAYVYRGHGGATARPEPVGRLDAPMERSGGAGYFRHDSQTVAVAPDAAAAGSEGGARGGRSRGRRSEAPADERVEPRFETRSDAPAERPAGGYFRQQAPAVVPAEAVTPAEAAVAVVEVVGSALSGLERADVPSAAEPAAVAGSEPAAAPSGPRSRRAASAPRKSGGRKAAATAEPAPSETGAPATGGTVPHTEAAPVKAAASRTRKPRNSKPAE